MRNPANPDIKAGVQAGLAAVRTLHEGGYGTPGTSAVNADLTFPLETIAQEIAQEIAQPREQFINTLVRDPVRFVQPRSHTTRLRSGERFWTILQDRYTGPLYDLAAQVVLYGSEVTLKEIPRAEFGKLLTVDRQEIESFRSIGNLIVEYCEKESPDQPLSVAVFGPPGAGKSFGIKQMANSILPDKIEELTFNLSQFDTEKELHDAFHQVRDAGLSGKIPLVFWDEFDTSMGTMAPASNSPSPFSAIFRHLASSLLAARNSNLSITLPGSRVVSPIDSTRTLRSIWATMISMCLSLISTRWLR
jgi:hypothetical protein